MSNPQDGAEQADEWTPAIVAAFPTRSGSHAEFATAMRMVGNRYSKAALVSLVNWLLVEVRQRDEHIKALEAAPSPADTGSTEQT